MSKRKDYGEVHGKNSFENFYHSNCVHIRQIFILHVNASELD